MPSQSARHTRPAGAVSDLPPPRLRLQVHRLRRLQVGWPALGVAIAGWVWAAWQMRDDGWFGGDIEVAVSFGAFWVVVVLLAMALWDFLVAIDDDPGNPSLGFGPQRFPSSLAAWLTPVSLIIGLLLGHWFWQ